LQIKEKKMGFRNENNIQAGSKSNTKRLLENNLTEPVIHLFQAHFPFISFHLSSASFCAGPPDKLTEVFITFGLKGGFRGQ